MSSSTMMMYTLRSSDNQTFEVSEQVAMMSQTVKHLIEDECFEDGIPLPNVKASVLAKIVEYCNKHAVAAAGDSNNTAGEGTSSSNGGTVIVDEDLKAWDKTFMQDIKADQGMLFDLIMATNYMNIKELLDLTCQTVADMIKGKQPEAIRKTFNILNDFTPEEEAEIRRENEWAFE